MMPVFFDDKSAYCIPFILERLKIHQEQHAAEAEAPPFFIGMNGVQGAGKTTLVRYVMPVHDYSADLITGCIDACSFVFQCLCGFNASLSCQCLV